MVTLTLLLWPPASLRLLHRRVLLAGLVQLLQVQQLHLPVHRLALLLRPLHRRVAGFAQSPGGCLFARKIPLELQLIACKL